MIPLKMLLKISLFALIVTFFQSEVFAQTTLIHYWSFNSLTTAYHNPGIPPVQADLSVIDVTRANVVYWLTATNTNYVGYWDNVAGDTTNARSGFPAGNALRFRNPSDSVEMRVYTPTTNYKNIVLKWEVESSSVGSGQKTQLFDYSIDSGMTWKTSGLSVTSVDITQAVFQGSSWGLIAVSISDTLAFNNPKLVFRIKFSGNTGLTSGNNRIDNLTVEGTFIPPVSNVPLSLIHYWNFNTFLSAYHNPNIPQLTADFSALDTSKAKLAYTFSPGTSSSYAGYIDNNPGDVTNARIGASAGQSLRFRNPSDSAELRLIFPTNNYKNIVIKYALQSSSAASGQQMQLFDYSTDAGFSWKTSGLSMTSLDVTQPIFQGTNWGLVTININDSSVNNSFGIIFRIRFAGNTTGSSGNNRFDNITVEGLYAPIPPAVITITSPSQGDILTVGKHALINFGVSGPVDPTREIEYTTDRGLTWNYISALTGTSYDWIVPNTPSSNVYIRIHDKKLNWTAVGPVTILYPGPGVIFVKTPVVGDSIIAGNHETIAFGVSGLVSDTRTIEFSADSGRSWSLVSSIFQVNGFDWVTPTTPAKNCFIRIRDTANVIGISGRFSLVAPIIPTTKTALIHYWNFDNFVPAASPATATYQSPNFPHFKADYSSIDTNKAYLEYDMLKPGLAIGYTYVDGVADADTTNLRSIVGKTSSVNAIRFRNPTDSSILQWHIPTTGFTNIVVKYGLESSSTTSGQLTELFDYSIDGGVTWKNHTSGGILTVNGANIDTLDVTQTQYQSATLFGLVTLTFGTDKTVENNPNLIVRVRFNGNTPKTSGNNRWDNFTVEGSPMQSLALIHYWNFDNFVPAASPATATYQSPNFPHFKADYSTIDTNKAYLEYDMLKPGLAVGYTYVDGVADADTTNLRNILGKTSSVNAIRFRNPTDSSILQWHIPTTGFTNIIVKYGLESSSTTSGQLTELFDYSVDGGLTWKNHTSGGTLTVNGVNIDTLDVTQTQYQSATLFGLVTLTFGADKTVENNPNLIVRVRFNGNTPKTSGNNRWDNLTVEGSGAISAPAPSITVVAPALHDTLVVSQHKTISFYALGAVGAKRTIEFSSDSSKTWTQLAVVTEGTTYDWIVPDTLTGKGFIRIRDSANVIGMSGIFAIVQPGTVLTITVGTTPGIVKPGDSALIAWTTSGYIGSTVNVDLSLDSQKTWTAVKAAYAYKTKSNYPWAAPTGTHLGARIRLTFASGANGISAPFDIRDVTAGISSSQNENAIRIWPNPFKGSTTITYYLAENSSVVFAVYDLLGRQVLHLENTMEQVGEHSMEFDGSHLSEGTYLYRLTACGAVRQGKLMIAR